MYHINLTPITNTRYPHNSDPDQKFELALDLKQLDTAKALLEEIRAAEAARDRGGSGEVSTETQTKWRKLGDLVRGLYIVYMYVGVCVWIRGAETGRLVGAFCSSLCTCRYSF